MNIALPDPHAIAVLLLTMLALFLFTREKIPLESTSLFVLVVLAVGFRLFPYQAADGVVEVSEFFYGFGHKALVAVCALMIVGNGLVRTGALEPVGRSLARLWKRGPLVSLLATLLVTAALSAFINNTPIVVLMLPLLVGVAMRSNTSPTRMLLPMGLASLVGGMSTTIGTSTNLLVVSVAEDMGVAPFQMFDFLLPAGIAGLIAILYLWLIAPRLLPDRQAPLESTSPRVFTAQLVLDEDSPVVGETLSAAMMRTEGALRVDKIQRGPGAFVTPLPDVELRAGDRLSTSDTPTRLREFARTLGGTLYSGQHPVDEDHPLASGDEQLAEVAITGASPLVGTRLNQARLQSRYGIEFLALHRQEKEENRMSRDIDEVVLQSGDVLLVQATPKNLGVCKSSGDFLVLDGTTELPHTRKAPIALLTMVGVVALAALGLLPIEVSALAGCLVMIITGCIRWRDATGALSAQVILIVVSSLALGAALMKTGGAAFMAQVFLAATFGLPPALVLAGLILLMGLMTNVVSNNAAAVIGTPIAIEIATRLGLPAEPFVLAVLFGANLSFGTPMAYQTNLLVMNAGGYKFNDFVRVGVPLIFIMWLALTGLLVYAYQLY
ncbi:MAG: SLC13 family permease [Xanthomonadales bacterium]|nr:SLC13 family permease [Xanthomonadales bacterium]